LTAATCHKIKETHLCCTVGCSSNATGVGNVFKLKKNCFLAVYFASRLWHSGHACYQGQTFWQNITVGKYIS